MIDRPDDTGGYQVHIIYAIPSDGTDETLDVSGALAHSVASFERWLRGQTGGTTVRLDTYQGTLDITFVRLSLTDAQIRGSNQYVRDVVQTEVVARGFKDRGKLYAVYYGGSSNFSCGGGAWPPALPGNVAALYLKGEPPGAPPCSTNRFTQQETQPGYLEFSMLHEIMHTVGVVATCAPNHTRAGHLSDDPRDLMYAGSLPWRPSILDVGHDDYYRSATPGCLDFATSAFLDPLPANATLPPLWGQIPVFTR